jgi:RNA polymerase primary sigma factor
MALDLLHPAHPAVRRGARKEAVMSAAATDSCRYAPVLDPDATRPLSRAEEQVFTRRYKASRDPDALRRLVESNQHFVIMVARSYQGMGLPLEDLVSEGNIGLLQAADRFDPTKGIKFITYAVWWIRRAILQALSDQSRLVRLPKYKIRQVREVRDRHDELRRSLGREPEIADTARATGYSTAEVDELLQLGAFELSMDVELESGDGNPYDSYMSCDTTERDYYDDEVRRIVKDAIDRLSAKERHVVLRRFEFVEGERNTLESISRELGLTKERVRQIELQAKRRLKAWFESSPRNLRIVDGNPA